MDGGQTPLLIVHWKILLPTPKVLTAVVLEVGLVMVPLPATTLQLPVPTAGTFAVIVAVVAQMVWLEPATAVVGKLSRNITTVSERGVQPAELTCQTNVFAPTPKPVI